MCAFLKLGFFHEWCHKVEGWSWVLLCLLFLYYLCLYRYKFETSFANISGSNGLILLKFFLFYKDINIFISHVLEIYLKHYLSEPCVDWPSICEKPFISSSSGWECQVPRITPREPLNLSYHLYRHTSMMCYFLISYSLVVLWTCMCHFLIWCKELKEI